MSVIMLPGNGMKEEVSIDLLIDLEEAGFEDAVLAMRDRDSEHVERLVETPMSSLPPIETVKVQVSGSVYYAVIDGYHRWDACNTREDTRVFVIARSYPDENAVIDAAFQANLKHGLTASKGTRSEYAVWLYLTDTQHRLSVRDIARKVGLNASTVSRAIKKVEQEEADEEEGGVTHAEVGNAQKLLNALRKFYTEERSLLGTFGKGDSKADVQARAKCLYRAVASIQKEKQRDAMKELASLKDTLECFLDIVTASSSSKKAATKR